MGNQPGNSEFSDIWALDPDINTQIHNKQAAEIARRGLRGEIGCPKIFTNKQVKSEVQRAENAISPKQAVPAQKGKRKIKGVDPCFGVTAKMNFGRTKWKTSPQIAREMSRHMVALGDVIDPEKLP